MNPSASNRKMADDRIAGRVGGLPVGLRCAGLATMALLFWTASAPACSVVNGYITVTGDVTTDCVEVTENGKIYITGTGKLTLTGSPGNISTINGGGIELGASGAELAFTTTDHFLIGGSAIEGKSSGTRITLGSDNLDLTSNITICGALALTESGSPSNTNFVNSGTVRADIADTLDIDVDSFSGCGDWRVNTNSNAILQFSVSPSSLCGDFYISYGTLLLLDGVRISTTGDLATFDHDGRIVLGDSTWIKFNQ